MVQMKDIAKALNVSLSLVSKVLNDRMGTTAARPELVTRIRKTAKKLGYRKNYSAAGLRHGRHSAFGLFIHKLGLASSGLTENFITGISGAAGEMHQKQILNFFEDAEQFRDQAVNINRGMVDGLIVAGVAHPELVKDLLEIREMGIPVVTVNQEQLHESLPNVVIDQVAIGFVATEHLIRQGCRRIAHLKVINERFEGYKAALENGGLDYDPQLVYERQSSGPEDGTSYLYQFGEKGIGDLIERGVEFDGIFTQSDEQAMAALNILHFRGVRIPQQVRIVGCDNSPYCGFTVIPLSSVSQDYREQGDLAVRMLMDLIDGKKVESATVRPKLFVRKSSE